MKLTKENIQFIDNYLIKNEVKYWDIRMEMTDHIASDIEINYNEHFDTAFQASIEKLKWNENYLKDIQCVRLKTINKKIRRQYFIEFANIFKKVNSLIILILGILLYGFIYTRFNTSIFKIISLILFSVPPVVYILNFLLMFLKKAYKSGSLLYSSFYVFFSFLVLNMFVQFSKPDGIFSSTIETQKAILFIVTIINALFTYAGLKVHFRTLKNTQAIYTKLMT